MCKYSTNTSEYFLRIQIDNRPYLVASRFQFKSKQFDCKRKFLKSCSPFEFIHKRIRYVRATLQLNRNERFLLEFIYPKNWEKRIPNPCLEKLESLISQHTLLNWCDAPNVVFTLKQHKFMIVIVIR